MENRERTKLIQIVASTLSDKIHLGYAVKVELSELQEISDVCWTDWGKIYRDIIAKKVIPWPHREGRQVLELKLTCGHFDRLDDLEYPHRYARCVLCEIESFSLFKQIAMSPSGLAKLIEPPPVLINPPIPVQRRGRPSRLVAQAV